MLNDIQPPSVLTTALSGVDSDSDSILTPDVAPTTPLAASVTHGGALTQPPLSSIAEARTNSGGEDTEDEEDDQEGGWKSATRHNSVDETVIKTGYLWKKGERRKASISY